ncbi:MAG: ATP-grasp domain-containing protein [Terriglobales bacterium]
MKPTVLVATTCRWFSTTRLAIALADAGFATEAVCPPGHPIAKISSTTRVNTYRGLRPIESLRRAIAAAKPDLIVPSDDLATRHLFDLYERECSARTGEFDIRGSIERSIGAPANFSGLKSRTRLIEIAERERIRVPKTAVIQNLGELKRWTAQQGFPSVLKADGTSGGTGVRVVQTFEEAERNFLELQAPPSFAKIATQLRGERDSTRIVPWLRRQRTLVNAQTFISGREATSTIACWKGTVIASLHFEVLKTAYPGGPSTVVRWIENADMREAAEKMVRRLNLSGIHGLDFIFDGDNGRPFLIEINHRATQVGHLALGPERDLPAALFAAVSGGLPRPAPKVTDNPTIAFFPQEWIRDPDSEFLSSAHHDVPWGEPKLIQACVAALPRPTAFRLTQSGIVPCLPARNRS